MQEITTSAAKMARKNVKAGETMAMMTGKSTATMGDDAHALVMSSVMTFSNV